MRDLQAARGTALSGGTRSDDGREGGEPADHEPPAHESGAAGPRRNGIQHNERVPAPADSEETANAGDPPTDTATVPAARSRRLTALLVAVAVFVIALDVITKIIVVATLSDRGPKRTLGGLIYVLETRNTGAAFNLAEGATVILTVIAAAVIVIIVRISSRLQSRWWCVALGLVLGGAAGNLSDRIFRGPGPLRGAVVDWISFLDPNAPGWHWPVFNIADASIVCGGITAVILMLLGYDVSGERAPRGED